MRTAGWWVVGLVLADACVGGCARWSSESARAEPQIAKPAPLDGAPGLMLWAWETPEDLRALRPEAAGVAFLAREVFLAAPASVTVRPRRQPLRVADGTYVMADVRVELLSGFEAGKTTADEVAAAIAVAAGERNVRALQVDFDAPASQWEFYARALRALRARLPAGMPLSMTALVSWCGNRSWLHDLPVNEAVPMFFRMGGPRDSRAVASKDATVVREEKCSGSAGVSTDETWPALHSGERVYVFRPGPWTVDDVAKVNASGAAGLQAR